MDRFIAAYGTGTEVVETTATAGAPTSTIRSRRWSTSSWLPVWPDSESSQRCHAAWSTTR